MEFGCGYGTFTLPVSCIIFVFSVSKIFVHFLGSVNLIRQVAERVKQLYSFDIDQQMVHSTNQRDSAVADFDSL